MVIIFSLLRYEKLFSGHYIGDLARLVLLKLTEEGLAFRGKISEKLTKWRTFTAMHLSNICRLVVNLVNAV